MQAAVRDLAETLKLKLSIVNLESVGALRTDLRVVRGEIKGGFSQFERAHVHNNGSHSSASTISRASEPELRQQQRKIDEDTAVVVSVAESEIEACHSQICDEYCRGGLQLQVERRFTPLAEVKARAHSHLHACS